MIITNWFELRIVKEILCAQGRLPLIFIATLLAISPAYAEKEKAGSWAFNKETESASVEAAEHAKVTATEAESQESEVVEESTVDAPTEAPQNSVVDALPANDSEVVEQAAASVEKDANDTQEQKPVAETPTQTAGMKIPTTPEIDLSPQLRNSLKAQYQRMREHVETEDAFSEALGEEYLSYGLLLRRAGRLDEARDMFTKALHISKINNGIYSIEQRPVLRALFETNFADDKAEDFEANLNRIIWIEKKHPGIKNQLTYELLIKVGNYYIDRFLFPRAGAEVGADYLGKANRYLTYAAREYDNLPLRERLLPYGEIALIGVLRGKVEVKLDNRPSNFDHSSQLIPGVLGQSNPETLKKEAAINKSFSEGERFLKRYLRKATLEENREQVVEALLGLGDVNLLFSRKRHAAQYYELAWLEAQKLPSNHPLIKSFEKPVELPDFNYALRRTSVESKRASVYVPLTFNVGRGGRVSNIGKLSRDDELFSKARRIARRLIFRPVIDRGSMVATEQFEHDIRVTVKRNTES